MGQAQGARQKVAKCVSELYNVVDGAVRDTAERLKAKPPSAIEPAGFAAFVDAARKAELTEAHDLFVNAALTLYLAPAKTWTEQIDRLPALPAGATDAPVVLPLI